MKLKNNKDKSNENKEEKFDLLDEHKTMIENEYTVKLKESTECLITVFLGYFFGILQKNITTCSSEHNNNNYNLIIGEPDAILIEAIKNSKSYKKMKEMQLKVKDEDNKTIKNNKSSSEIKILIEGENIIPEFAEKSNYSQNFDIINNKENQEQESDYKK